MTHVKFDSCWKIFQQKQLTLKTQRHSEALRGTQRHSGALRGTQGHSGALSDDITTDLFSVGEDGTRWAPVGGIVSTERSPREGYEESVDDPGMDVGWQRL